MEIACRRKRKWKKTSRKLHFPFIPFRFVAKTIHASRRNLPRLLFRKGYTSRPTKCLFHSHGREKCVIMSAAQVRAGASRSRQNCNRPIARLLNHAGWDWVLLRETMRRYNVSLCPRRERRIEFYLRQMTQFESRGFRVPIPLWNGLPEIPNDNKRSVEYFSRWISRFTLSFPPTN